MKRVMIWATALMLMVAGMAVSQEANAGLFNRKSDCCKPKKCKKSRRAAKNCCQPAQCCAPAPTCCTAAPVCAAPAPAPCGCAAPAPAPCGCAAAPAPSCGCEVASNCGCEAAPNCDCLSKRQLRRANRKGECCGAVAKSCNTCSAAVQTCGYAAPVQGCSSCSGGVIIESTPSPAAGEEAAPEAPESTT